MAFIGEKGNIISKTITKQCNRYHNMGSRSWCEGHGGKPKLVREIEYGNTWRQEMEKSLKKECENM